MKNDFPQDGGTQTTLGWIPHLAMRTGRGQDFHAPVKLVQAGEPLVQQVMGNRLTYWFAPLTVDGRLVYALPGGRELICAEKFEGGL